jgi:hypothetical protein
MANTFIFSIIMWVRYLGRFKQKKALRTHLSRRWANPDIGRPEAVVKYLINLQQERHQDQFDMDDNANINANVSNNRNWSRRRTKKRDSDRPDWTTRVDDVDIESGERYMLGHSRMKKPAWLALAPGKRSSEFSSEEELESNTDSETSLLSRGDDELSRSSSESVEGIDSDYVYSSTDSELNLAF